MRYRTLTMPIGDLEGLVELARMGREAIAEPLVPTPEQIKGLWRAELALLGERMPGHAPGKPHRGPDLDLTNRHNTHRKAAP